MDKELIEYISYALFVCDEHVIFQKSSIISSLCLELKSEPNNFQNSFGLDDSLLVLWWK